jgi:NodT family efflux transporter outer membrane factor (OMF) lipoprotein
LRKRYENGLENKGAVSQAQSAASSVEAELLRLQESIVLQKNSLAALMGKGPARGESIVAPQCDLSKHFGLPGDSGVGLLGRRPDISAARWRVEAASHYIEAAKAQFYPDVSLSAFIGLQAFGLSDLFDSGNDAGNIGPAIYLPIFTGGRLEANLSSAEADYELAVSNYNETLVQAICQVADAATSMQALEGRIVKTREAVEAAKDAHQIATNRYEGGLARYLDVLTAEDALLTSERMLVNLESRAFSLDLALVHALGGGYQEQSP